MKFLDKINKKRREIFGLEPLLDESVPQMLSPGYFYVEGERYIPKQMLGNITLMLQNVHTEKFFSDDIKCRVKIEWDME